MRIRGMVAPLHTDGGSKVMGHVLKNEGLMTHWALGEKIVYDSVRIVLFFRPENQCTINPIMKKENSTITTGRLIGYARVSTNDQELALQLDALMEQGCQRDLIFIDHSSGAKAQRPGLDACLGILQEGDLLLVWRLDRLGRSMPHLVRVIETLRKRGVGFRSICDGIIDTTTASGELIFNMFSALVQFEQRLIQERTRAGLRAARARGRKGGRRPLNLDDPRVQTAKAMYKNKSVAIKDICGRYVYLARHSIDFLPYESRASKRGFRLPGARPYVPRDSGSIL